MYVRTKYGITQYKEYETTIGKLICMPVKNGAEGIFADIEDIIGQPSYNIIDLIEVGDYVNGHKISLVYNHQVYSDDYEFNSVEGEFNRIHFENDDIKSIVTKEQFESMQYKVGERYGFMDKNTEKKIMSNN